MKKGFWKTRTCAVLAMCAMIVLSVPVGACVSVSRVRDNAERRYTGDDDTWGLADDVLLCSSAAANLMTLGARLLPAENEETTALTRAREALDAAVRPAEKYAALSNLTDRFHALYGKLSALDLSEKDREDCDGVLADFNADLDMISRDDYNREAASFNSILETTPGGAIASLFGARPLELFAPGSAGGEP